MLRACSSKERELSNDLLKRHSWPAIEAVNVPASAMVETTVPKGVPPSSWQPRELRIKVTMIAGVVRLVGRYEAIRSMIYH